jgi:hypothetical protein
MVSKAYCIIIGDYFSPAKVEKITGLRFNSKNERGDISKTGRYKNKALPYGSAVLESDPNDDYVIQSHNILDLLLIHIDRIRDGGATDIIFHISYMYEMQCNMEFDVDFIMKLEKLRIPLNVSCYEAER